MSVWTEIQFSPKAGTPVDLWGADQTEETSRSLMMAHEVYMRRWPDCHWSPRVRTDSGLLMNLPDGWYFRKTWHSRRDDLREDWKRIYPTHYMEIPKGPNT